MVFQRMALLVPFGFAIRNQIIVYNPEIDEDRLSRDPSDLIYMFSQILPSAQVLPTAVVELDGFGR